MPRSAPTSTTCSTSCRDPPGPPRRRSGESSLLPRTCCSVSSSSSGARRSTPERGGLHGFAPSSTVSPIPRSSRRCTAHRRPASTSTSSCGACARSGRASPACPTASASSASWDASSSTPASIISRTAATPSTTSARPTGVPATCGGASRWWRRGATLPAAAGSTPFSTPSWPTLPPGSYSRTGATGAARRRPVPTGAVPRSASSGWLVRRPEAGAVLATLALASLPPAVPGAAPQGRQPHYRWTQKTDTSLAALSPHPTSVTAILAGWAAPNIASRDRCAPRADRELRVFALTGWLRRVEKVKDDGDWHIELTEGAASPVDSCVVVEIPAPKYGSRYALARAALDSVIGDRKIGRRGVLERPVRARVVGAAFFDGQHRRGGRRSDEIDGEHGRCNSSVRALWEIHPVYRVMPP